MNKMDVFDTDSNSGNGAPTLQAQPLSPAPELDLEEYRADIAEFGMTTEQEAEFLQTLWSIMGHFARLGHSVDVCGLIFEEFNEASWSAAGTGTVMPSTNTSSASEPNGGSA